MHNAYILLLRNRLTSKSNSRLTESGAYSNCLSH